MKTLHTDVAFHFQVDLSIVSSVESNVSKNSAESIASSSSGQTLKDADKPVSTTKITIHGHLPSSPDKEQTLLTLFPQSHSVASEWVDGLLMLLNQQPITAETQKLVGVISNYGLKIRLLNVRFDDVLYASEEPEVPSREGLDEDYYYDVFGGA